MVVSSRARRSASLSVGWEERHRSACPRSRCTAVGVDLSLCCFALSGRLTLRLRPRAEAECSVPVLA
jgi:hypothetical protein